MADVTLIKPRELDPAVTVYADDAIMTDDGVNVGKATPVQIVNAGAPVASEAEAIAGTNNTKRMTPLTTAQVLANTAAPSVVRAQAWAESATAPDPLLPSSKSSKTWAGEAAASAGVAAGAAATAADDTANAITSAMQGYVTAASGSASAASTSETNAATSAGQAATSAGQAVTAMAGSVRFDQAQSLTTAQLNQARSNTSNRSLSVGGGWGWNADALAVTTIYTNTTGSDMIFVFRASLAIGARFEIQVDGFVQNIGFSESIAYTSSGLTYVPSGSTYQVLTVGTVTSPVFRRYMRT